MTQNISNAALAAGRAAASSLPRAAAGFAEAQVGAYLQSAIFGPRKRLGGGPRLESIRLLTAGEGGGVPRVYGRARIGGQVIWASQVREETRTVTSVRGAKGIRTASESSTTEYRYRVSLAVALCEGPVARLGRVWADGRPLPLKNIEHRFHRGDADQAPDPLIEIAEGAAPGYQGIAYVVFEDLDLAAFGNRIPQFNFEVIRPLQRDDPQALENTIRAVTIIPATGEAAYASEPVFEDDGEGLTRPLNMHNGRGITDAEASFDELQDIFPNLQAASLVVSWFGDDLRAGSCQIRPGVETAGRRTEPDRWTVAGKGRTEARLLSRTDSTPSYGGTPSDRSVVAAIGSLRSRGLAIAFHPFILMDIPQGNGLPDPYGGAEQAPFPWRGRITDVDGMAATRAAVDGFFTSYAAMVLHYARLCADAGGVDTFLIGSELRGLTMLRDETGAFPAVQALVALATEVKAILPDAVITYGADWTEYASYVPSDSDDLFFPLDHLWAAPSIDAVGIDNYFPLTDWRDGEHADRTIARGPYDVDYLQAGIASGEGYDWFYANDEDRLAQRRTPITDGAFGEPWVFRPKDLWSWWMSPHHERLAGIRQGPTPWKPQSKPILFTELGCAAIDRGPNQPNVFVDPKSSESTPPWFSSGGRDDRAQRSFLEAHHRFWNDPVNNPVSSITGLPMVDTGQIYVYAWDARPFPDFPARSDVWADAKNWATGHWLNGRAGRVVLSELIEELARDAGLHAIDASACDRLVSGLTLNEPGTGREVLEPLLDIFQLDAVQKGGIVTIRPRTGEVEGSIAESALVLLDDEPPLLIERAQDEELPSALSVTFIDELSDYEPKTVEVRDETAGSGRTARIVSTVILDEGEARAMARTILAEARAMRELAQFALPELADGIVPGSVIALHTEERSLTLRLTAETSDVFRSFEAVSTDPGVFVAAYEGIGADPAPPPPAFGGVVAAALDIPLLREGSSQAQLWLAAYAEPWPGAVTVVGAPAGGARNLLRQSLIGRLEHPLPPGCAGRWDRAAKLRVRIPSGALESVTAEEVLAGAHLCAVETAAGWELLQFRDAALDDGGSWTLGDLLRGRRGTEEEAAAGAEAGARFVLLDQAEATPLPADLWGVRLNLEAGPEGAEAGAYPFRPLDVVPSGTGERPFAPVHLGAAVSPGEITIHWIRRTRFGGDRFEGGEVPLGETLEAYEINLFDAADQLLSTLASSRPEVTITQGAATKVTVAQCSASYGPGRAAMMILP